MKKKLSLKKVILFFLISAIIFLCLYILWGIYKAQNISVVPIEDINSISISADEVLSTETEITGEVKVDRFEAVSHINKEKVDEVLYIIIHKEPSFFSKGTFSINLNDVNDVESINNISIISGNIYTGEGVERGYSLGDLKKIPDQEVIWEQPAD
ncbi:hypothetical protein ACFSTA_20410 [Ornithinibacillus salinisoli]|uniref:SAF domain-containing protein n=1 Tax=Ornithinibacillus salinisoli TaxID=1848459 RepID=A0ABW4W501_9BACI